LAAVLGLLVVTAGCSRPSTGTVMVVWNPTSASPVNASPAFGGTVKLVGATHTYNVYVGPSDQSTVQVLPGSYTWKVTALSGNCTGSTFHVTTGRSVPVFVTCSLP
jgi:hypothetical protein